MIAMETHLTMRQDRAARSGQVLDDGSSRWPLAAAAGDSKPHARVVGAGTGCLCARIVVVVVF